jgi:hypothetical protein
MRKLHASLPYNIADDRQCWRDCEKLVELGHRLCRVMSRLDPVPRSVTAALGDFGGPTIQFNLR